MLGNNEERHVSCARIGSIADDAAAAQYQPTVEELAIKDVK